MINEYEGLKPIQEGASQQITIKVNCQNIKNQQEKQFNVSLSTSLTLLQAKNIMTNRLSPPERPDDFDFILMVISRG